MLATSGLGEIGTNTILSDPEDVLGYLLFAQPLPDPVLHFSGVRSFGPADLLHEAGHCFTISIIGQSNDADFADTRMAEKPFFDLHGEYVLAACAISGPVPSYLCMGVRLTSDDDVFDASGH